MDWIALDYFKKIEWIVKGPWIFFYPSIYIQIHIHPNHPFATPTINSLCCCFNQCLAFKTKALVHLDICVLSFENEMDGSTYIFTINAYSTLLSHLPLIIDPQQLTLLFSFFTILLFTIGADKNFLFFSNNNVNNRSKVVEFFLRYSLQCPSTGEPHESSLKIASNSLAFLLFCIRKNSLGLEIGLMLTR